MYEFPADGYLMLRTPAAKGALSAIIYSSNGVKFFFQICGKQTSYSEYHSIYLRKGFKVYFSKYDVIDTDTVEALVYLFK